MRPRLCHVFPAFATGGPEVRTALLIDASSDLFEHTVVSLNGDLSGRSRIHAENVSFAAAPARRRFSFPSALARMLRDLRPDLVLTYGWGGIDAIAAARWSGFRRLIHGEDGFLPDEAQRQKFRRVMARRLLLRAPAYLVCPSHNLVRIATQTWWLPPRKVRLIPNGVDADRFAPASAEEISAARRRLGCKPEEIVIGTVGHLRSEKNQARLLRIFAALACQRPARLLLVGDGVLRPSLTQQAKEMGLADRVIFTGIALDPVDFYRAMDVFALSSDTEQMPIAVLEAMGMGLPVVSTDVGDVRRMVSDANRAYVVPLSREDLYADCLARLLDDAAARSALGAANRAKCLHDYSLTGMIQTYRELYGEILAATYPSSRLQTVGK